MKYITWKRALIVVGLCGLGVGIKPAYKALHPIVLPEDFVDVAVSFSDDGSCDKNMPLLIEMKNNSRRTVTKIDVWVSIKSAGHSTELMPGFQPPFSSDLILAPGGKHGYCWRLAPDINNKSFTYTLAKKEITFQ